MTKNNFFQGPFANTCVIMLKIIKIKISIKIMRVENSIKKIELTKKVKVSKKKFAFEF